MVMTTTMMMMIRPRRFAPLIAALALLSGCGSKEPTAREIPKAEDPATRQVEKAPEVYRVEFDTTRGKFVVEVNRAWSPRGADRFHELVNASFYDQGRFFRYVRNFIVQFGLNGDPKINQLWSTRRIPDDPVKHANERGTLAFAKSDVNTRTTQVFINLKDNSAVLDSQGFSPFGRVVEGMEVVDGLYSSYGEGPPRGNGPDQSMIHTEGNAYLARQFPRLDYIKIARVMK
jgi:peptidyl-prolyl cis-trans isomerase A (cyclophilin A)